MKGILLHGGHGTRLRPLTHTGPKQLLPIANKPMSQYCIESMRDSGVKDIIIIIGGTGSNKVREHYGNGEKFDVKISYIEQDYPRGIAHAIRLCKEFVANDKFLVFLGDNIIQKPIIDYVRNFEKSDDAASILLCEVDNPSRFGIADIKEGKILRIMEKPKNPPSNLAVTGIYLLTPKIFDVIDRLKPSWRNELEITDALHMLLEEKNRISYNMITDYWKDTGTPDDIINANGAILEKMAPYFHAKKEEDVSIEGKVMVGEGTILKNGAKVVGPAIIGKNCIIESGTIVGPNTSIGDNSRLAKCEISNSIVMADCNIESSIKIRNSIIAYNSSINSDSEKQSSKIFLLGEGTRITL
ncbi:MAG: glucose-1-phosphate thymidylyltransferase [Candidatus Nitrosotenuis sp.]